MVWSPRGGSNQPLIPGVAGIRRPSPCPILHFQADKLWRITIGHAICGNYAANLRSDSSAAVIIAINLRLNSRAGQELLICLCLQTRTIRQIGERDASID